jgi:hypothetical protein
MNDAVFKPSLNVESFIGENSSVNTERFLLFMKAYYEWMQSTTLSLSNKTGTFVVGETVVGATSGALATIKEVKTNSIVIAPTSRTVFAYAETVTGQTSGATATISIIKDNVGRASGNILNYKNLETSVDEYVDYLREELYPSIPATYYGDKQLVAQYFKDFFESKSNEQSYRFLFKLLYDENIDFYYPGEDILRISDGNFEKTQVIRTIAVSADNRDIFLFLNKTIRGQTSNVLANVVDIKKFFIGSVEIAEMTLKLVSGTFAAGEDIVDIDDEDLSTTIYGIVSGVTIVDGGSGYEDGDIITITGNGSEAQARVSSIKESPITALQVNTVGHGYQLNTNATIDNSGTGGSGFLVQVTALANTYSVTSGANTYTVGEISGVSILNRGEGYFKKPSVTLQDTTIASLGLLSNNLITIVNAGSNYGVGNTLVFTGGSGANAAGQIASVTETTTFDLLFEDGFQMKADGSYYDIIKNEDWLVKGPIKRIELTNFGTGYTSANLPSISITTTTGASANLVATNIQGKSANVTVDTSNNITGIGSIRAVQITNFGINYSTANATANTVGDGNANLIPIISGLGIKEGVWLDDDGKIDNKIIQDSYYYQDYSYVIKSGLAFETYSDTLKSIIHPAGLLNFGEIQILSELDGTSSLVENIQRMLVRIFTHLTVGGQYEYSNISMTLKVHSPLIDTSTNLLNVQEYVVILELSTGETSEVSIAENTFVIKVPVDTIDTSVTTITELLLSPEKSFIDVNANLLDSVTKLELVSEETSNVSIADISYGMQIDSEIDITSSSASLPASKLVISYTNVFSGYGITYEDIPMLSFGVFDEDWVNTTIGTLEFIAFGDFYHENPPRQSVYSLIDKTPDVVSVAMSSLNQEYSVLISSLGFMNYTTECIITTSSTSIDVIYIESIIDTSSSIAENTFVIKVPDITIDTSVIPGVTEVVLSPEKSFIDVNANLPQNTLELKLVLEETSEVSIAENSFVIQVPVITIDTSVVASVTELVLTPENSFIDVNANLSVQEYVVSFAPQEIPNNLEAANTTYISYQQISGTVTSTVQDYSTYTLSAFENVPISSIDNVQFDATAPVIVGTGTNFIADFSGGDVFVANNEYFIVQAVFGATNLVIDRSPITPFTNVVAYKINP